MAQYGDYLLRTAFLLLNDLQAAEEAVQDTFIQAYEKIDQLRAAEQLKSWLTRIVINRCRSTQRTWQWRNIFPFDRAYHLLEESIDSGPEKQYLDKWNNKRLSDAIQQLSYIYREVITLYYYNELNVREIAENVQSNENTIKARLVRGRQQLKQIIEQEESADERSKRTF